MATWVYPRGLSLTQLTSATFIDDEAKIAEFAADEAPDEVYDVLLKGGLRMERIRRGLPEKKQRLLALTFGHYLSAPELRQLLSHKTEPKEGKDSK